MIRQGGAALLVGLVLLLLITVLAVTGLRMSTASLRTAVNEQLRLDAFQRAQNLVDGVLAVPSNTQLTGKAGEFNCLAADPGSGCARRTLVLDPMPQASDVASGAIEVRMERLAPEFIGPPRGTGYSLVKFQAGQMAVDANYDQVDIGWGRAGVREGVAVVVPAPR